jgi:hypothetical protein
MSERVRSLLDNAQWAMKDGYHDIAENLISESLGLEPKNVKAARMMAEWQGAVRKKPRQNFLSIPWTSPVVFLWEIIPSWLRSLFQEIGYRFFR